MKQFLVLGVMATLTYMMVSCSPTVNNTEVPNALDTAATGKVTASGQTRLYQLFLTCGCPFAMRVDSADTSAIVYNTKDLKDTTSPHLVTASLKGSPGKGTYIGWIALHMAPPSLDTFHVTLRDTVVIP